MHVREGSLLTAPSRGAVGDGVSDDTAVFLQLIADDSASIVFIPDGTYLLTQSVTLSKPVVATAGAVFKVRA